MAGHNKLIQIASFNLHGLNQGSPVLQHICENLKSDIIFVQEHWQATFNLHKIMNFNNSCTGFGVCAFDDKITSGVLHGRPYGGVATLVRNDVIKYVHNTICTERFVIVCVGSVAFVNVYLPCKSVSDYLNVMQTTLDEIDVHLKACGTNSIIFAGDLNTDVRNRSNGSSIILDFANDFNLVPCSMLTTSLSDYTFQNSAGHRSWIDWIFVSNNLFNPLMSLDILDIEPNHSDHLPIFIKIDLPFTIPVPLNQNPKPVCSPRLKLRWDKSDHRLYYDTSRNILQPILDEFGPEFEEIFNDYTRSHANNFCCYLDVNSESYFNVKRATATSLIDKYYPLTVDAINSAANFAIPRVKSNVAKHWWNDDLQQAKSRSVESHRIWLDAGKPRSGLIFEIYKKDKYSYKHLIKCEKNETDLSITNDLHEYLCSKDINGFWKTWNSKINSKQKNNLNIVDGLVDAAEIAESFADFFRQTCSPNSFVNHENFSFTFQDRLKNYSGAYVSPEDFFSVETVSEVVNNLKTGRAAGLDGIMAEHLVYGHPSAIILLTYLCNLILLTGYVPKQFGLGLTFPIPKGQSGKKTVTFDDFRGITVSPLFSKVLEKCILANFGEYFWSLDNQFGFKKKLGCQHAIFCLRSVVDYFTNNGSNVNVCALDISKAFDKVCHSALFCKLLDRNVPINIIRIVSNWYTNSRATVFWNGAYSKCFPLCAGVRQGGVLSPVLFAVYANSVLERLRFTGMGCHIGTVFMGAFMYADDLVLISPSLTGVQKMINVCISEFNNLDMKINATKSTCVRFGRGFNSACAPLEIDGLPLSWSATLKYLGITLRSSVKFSVDIKPARTKFYQAFNSLYSKIWKASDLVIISLIKLFCLPSLYYGIETLDLNASTLHSLDKPLMHALGKIFKTYDSDLINTCLFYLRILPPRFEYYVRKINFLKKGFNCDNYLVWILCNLSGNFELNKICKKFDILPVNNMYKIRNVIWEKFENNLGL